MESLQDTIRALEDLIRSDLYKMVRIRQDEERRAVLENLAQPVNGVQGLVDHVWLGGVAEGLRFDAAEALLSELRQKQKGGLP